MRAPVLLVAALALVAGAGATTWSDRSKIKAAGGTGLAYHEERKRTRDSETEMAVSAQEIEAALTEALQADS